MRGKYLIYILIEDTSKGTMHFGAQETSDSVIPMTFVGKIDDVYAMGGSFSSFQPGWIDYMYISDTELWASFNYRDKVQVKYSINPADGSWTALDTYTYQSIPSSSSTQPYVKDILMYSSLHPEKIYTISLLDKKISSVDRYILEYLYQEPGLGLLTRVEHILGNEADFEAPPYLVNHPLSLKAMRTWDFKLDEAKQNVINDYFFISNQ